MSRWFKIFLLFFMFGLLVYFNSLNNKFLMDDYVFLKNPFLSNTKFILSQWNPYLQTRLYFEAHPYYRPIAYMLYDFCYGVFKNNFWQYHLFNLSLFVLASSLIYLVVGKISGNYNLAFLAGLFYLIHPINGVVVNYIPASCFSLEVIFMLGTILLLWGSLERKNNRALYALSLLFSFLSLFWHESGMMTPFYVSAAVVLFRKGPFKEKAFYLSPYFLIVFSYIVFRAFFLNINEIILEQKAIFHMAVWEYPANLFRVFMWYITRLFYPRGIVLQWATPVLHQNIFWNNLGTGSLLMLFIFLFVRFAKEKICQLAVTWALIGFVPACLAVFRTPDVGVYIEPHWFIFSSIGFFILAAYFLLIILDRTKKYGLALLFVVIFSWGVASHAHNQVWANQKTYARYWSQQVPNLKCTYRYLAESYQDEGAFHEARKYYRLALNAYPSDVSLYNNLGIMDAQDGRWKEAELNYKRALKIDPFSGRIYNNLGSIYFKQGQWGKSKEYFSQALILNPFLLESRLILQRFF